jgi:hypothetical protein
MTEKPQKYLSILGTRTALVAGFTTSNIFLAEVIQGIGRELLQAADMAARIDMPLTISFQGVESISSALIAKLVLLNKKAKSHRIKLSFVDISPAVRDVFRRVMGDDGLGLQ